MGRFPRHTHARAHIVGRSSERLGSIPRANSARSGLPDLDGAAHLKPQNQNDTPAATATGEVLGEEALRAATGETAAEEHGRSRPRWKLSA